MIRIPKDRDGEFEPEIVKKNQRDISGIEDQVLSMYVKCVSIRGISNTYFRFNRQDTYNGTRAVK